MATATVRPTGTAQIDAGWTVTGAASANAATSDNSDASYTTSTATVGPIVSLDMDTVAPPALAQYRSVTPRIRINSATGPWVSDGPALEVGGVRTAYDQITWATAIATATGAARTTAPSGQPWTQALIDSLRVVYRKGMNLIGQSVYEVYADVVYNEVPVVFATAPTGTVITAQPTLTHSYSDPEFDPQERVRWKVFSAAQYGAVGFDPETSTATWDSGEIFSAQFDTVVSIPLPNNTTYRAYVKAADAGSSGRYSLWAFTTFTVTIDAPAAPAVTPTGDPANARVALAAQGFDNLLTANQSMVETGTVGFVAITNAGTLTRDTAQFRQGVASLRFQSVAGGDMKVGTLTGLNGATAVAGQVYTGFVSIRPASNRAVRAELAFYDAAGAQIGANTTGASASPGAGVWSDRSVSATAPALTATVAVIPAVLATGAGAEQAWADQFGVAPGTPAAWSRGGFVLDAGRLADAFGRADTSVAIGTADVGGAWSSLIGTWGITVGRAYQVTTVANGVALLTSSLLADGIIQADITLSAVANQAQSGLVFRAADNNNMLLVELNKTGTGASDAINLLKRVAGTFTNLGTVPSMGLVNGSTYTLRVEFYGTAIRVLVNGVVRLAVLLSAADLAAFGNNARYGLYNNAFADRFDNFTAGNPKSQLFRAQRSADGGVTWLDVREAYRRALTDPLETGTFYDNEANRGILLQYRARIEATEGANFLVSPWSTPTTVTLASDGNAWFKSPSDSTLNRAVLQIADGLPSQSPDDSSVLYAEGRRNPIIYTGPIRGEVFSIPLFFANDAAWVAFEALRARGEPILFQTCYGDSGDEQYWVRLGARNLTRITSDGMNTAQYRRADIAAWEVAVPAVT